MPFGQEVAVLGFKDKHFSSGARDSEPGPGAGAATPSSVGRWVRILRFICRA